MPTSQSLACTLNLAKETVRFIVNPSGEEERICRTCRGTVAKGQAPQAIHRDEQAFLVFQGTQLSTRVGIKRVNAPIAKVSHQQRIAELAKIGGSESHAPWRIQCAT